MWMLKNVLSEQQCELEDLRIGLRTYVHYENHLINCDIL